MSLPEPLVPAGVSLKGMPAFQLDVERLLASELVALGSPAECWAALMLWCRAWQQTPPASLPNNDAVLAAFSGARERWPEVREMALRGFVLCSDGRLYHRVLAEQAIKAWASRLRFRELQKATAERVKRYRERQAAQHNRPQPARKPAKAAQKAGQKAVTLPEWLPADAWAAYEESRRRMRKPMTDRARALAIARLDELRGKGHDPRAVLDASVLHGWVGLFEPKPAGDRTAVSMRRATKPDVVDYTMGVCADGSF